MADRAWTAAVVGEPAGELEREAAYVAMLYDRLDADRAHLQRRLSDVRLAPAGGTPQSRTERDVLAHQLEGRLDALAIGDLPLCFGRLDLDDGSRLYVGRVGIAGDGEDPLLMDWRAPKASLFYSATSGSPQGVVRRRHLIIRNRQLVAIDDEVFDLEALGGEAILELQGDGALLAALSRERTTYMRDIVATIQAEQDAVIRSDLAGALVVQGGPGTGKTAVALHRAAYLLYTHRLRLASSGVLVMGPSPVFLRYIEQVLPSLGETGAVMATTRSLFPGVRPSRNDPVATAELKGSPEMARVIANAIRDRQRAPREGAEIAFERSRVVFSRAMLDQARGRGQRSRHPHNQARRAVEASLLDTALAQVRASRQQSGLPQPTEEEVADLRSGLPRTREYPALMERMWPILSPQELLNDLFGTPALVRSATKGLPGIDPSLLVRDRSVDAADVLWSVEDVPLLDEAAERLGSWTEREERRAARRRSAQRRRELEYARSTLRSMDLEIDISAEGFAARFAEHGEGSIVEQSSRDRTWKFGHMIVDESQELSPMAWQMLFRRVPNRSMTIVGDLAQCSASWAPASWDEILEPFARDRWRLFELSTNYRTPNEIMEVANAVLAVAAPDSQPTVAIRSVGHLPTHRLAAPGELFASVGEEVDRLRREIISGRLAVIAPSEKISALADALSNRLGDAFDPLNPLAAEVALVTVAEAKGLEFDAVVIVEPIEIALAGSRGQNDLYVALTRATQRLSIVHERAMTDELATYFGTAATPRARPEGAPAVEHPTAPEPMQLFGWDDLGDR